MKIDDCRLAIYTHGVYHHGLLAMDYGRFLVLGDEPWERYLSSLARPAARSDGCHTLHRFARCWAKKTPPMKKAIVVHERGEEEQVALRNIAESV